MVNFISCCTRDTHHKFVSASCRSHCNYCFCFFDWIFKIKIGHWMAHRWHCVYGCNNVSVCVPFLTSRPFFMGSVIWLLHPFGSFANQYISILINWQVCGSSFIDWIMQTLCLHFFLCCALTSLAFFAIVFWTKSWMTLDKQSSCDDTSGHPISWFFFFTKKRTNWC